MTPLTKVPAVSGSNAPTPYLILNIVAVGSVHPKSAEFVVIFTAVKAVGGKQDNKVVVVYFNDQGL